MRQWIAVFIPIAIWLGVATASADDGPVSQLSGRVLDQTHGGPVEGAVVIVAGADGTSRSATSDRTGRYAIAVRGGTYTVTFAQGKSRSSARVVVEPGKPAQLDGRVDSVTGEVIVIRDRVKPAVLPKPTNFSPLKAPPYSDQAVLSDAWTKAWLLLDLDERGVVTRFKFLKKPGYDLEKIAVTEAFKLKFDPARDDQGRAVRAWVVWGIEWPSAGWLVQFNGTRSAMPKVRGFPPRRQDWYVPCAGGGQGWAMGSLYPTYKDCSRPDLSKAANEPWVVPGQAAVAAKAR